MKITIMLGVLPLLVGACAPAPTPLPTVDAQLAVATATEISLDTGYRDPFAGFQGRQAAGPLSWRALNDAQSEGN